MTATTRKKEEKKKKEKKLATTATSLLPYAGALSMGALVRSGGRGGQPGGEEGRRGDAAKAKAGCPGGRDAAARRRCRWERCGKARGGAGGVFASTPGDRCSGPGPGWRSWAV